MFKVAEFPLKSNDVVTLEVPINSQFLNVGIKQNMPVVSMLLNTAQQITEQVRLLTVESGEEFGSVLIGDHPHYVGTFQHARKLPPKEEGGVPIVDVKMLHVFIFREKSHATSNAPGNSIIL